MKLISNKILISFLLIGLLMMSDVLAQNADSIRMYLRINDLPKAKELIDELVVDSPGVAENWLLKAKVYQLIGSSDRFKDLVPDAQGDAFFALKKVYLLNAGLLSTDSTANNIYKSYTDQGVAFFNAGTERKSTSDFSQSLNYFKKAAIIGEFIAEKALLSIQDTANLYYLAKSAIYAENEEESLIFAQKIVNLGLNDPKIEIIYQWLLHYYSKIGDEKLLDKYSLIAKKAYPQSNYYLLNYIDFYRKLKDVKYLIKSYNQLFDRGFVSTDYKLSYIKDLYYFSYVDTTSAVISYQNDKILDSMRLYLLHDELKAFIQSNPENAEGLLIAGKFYVNRAADYQGKLLRLTESDVNKKRIFGKIIISSMLLSNAYLKKISDRLPKADKNLQIEATKLLIRNYEVLQLPKPSTRYKVKLKHLLK